MSRGRIITILIIIVVAAAAGLAVWRSSAPAGSTLEQTKQAGVLRVGYANEAPFAYLDTASGQVTGEAVEIIRVVAKRLGIAKVEGVLTEFGALIPGLQAERFDVIAAGMYITAPRATQVAFTDPTYVVREGFLVAKGNPLKLHSYADVIAHPTARIGVVAGAIQYSFCKDLGVPEAKVVVFPDNASGVAGMAAGRIEALGLTSMTIRDLLQRGAAKDYESAQPFVDPMIDGKPVRGYGAFAVRSTDTDLHDAINRELHAFLGTPEHVALVKPFGFGPEHQTAGATVEQVLSGNLPDVQPAAKPAQ